ncbi:MAG: S8 family serine peptidase, partial [Clostridia bacterium]|nr:S8 family serine peptidase [Clostridia bacterium]
MRKTVISVCMAFAMAASCVACAVAPEDETLKNDGGIQSQKIELIKSDVKFTQEQSLSRIKAEYLKENGGYKDSDAVVAIVTLKENAVIDDYLAKEDVKVTLSDYAAGEGKAQAKRQEMLQNALISELTRNNLISGVENRYTTVLNGIAVNTEYGKLADIKKISGVDGVILSDTYNRVQVARDAEASGIVNNVDVYETGIFNSASVDFTGKHTAVAVLDSGFDCSHSVFARQPEGELLVTQQTVSETLPRMNASTTTRGLEMTDVWYSRKIPYAYDYADKDNDVFPYESEHGTHVAGIIGGKDDVITGVAVDTQLVLMKVFPDLDDGAKTDDILAGLEDSVMLGVDAINMSLGSSCGFSREEDGNKINDVYDKINDSGVSLITAASNSYSSAFGGEQGNTNKVTNPDSGTVGSPSTYAAALSVASISGVKSSYLVANGKDVIFFTESSSITGKPNDFVAELDKAGALDNGSKEFEYVTVPGYGKQINYSSVDVHGKIALVRRGDNTFEDKALQAKLNGAVACIIYNNVEGDISMSMGKTDHIPTVSITKEKGTMLAAHDTGTIKVDLNSKAGPFMSDFSSWGPSPNLELKPEITAHGGTIKSSVPGGDYDELSGTSMASPNLCGIVVLIRQFLKEKYPDYDYKQIVTLCNQMLMSTATIVLNEEGNPYSPRKQGAGLASLYNVVNTKAYLSVDGKDRSKLELGDDAERKGVYEMEFNVVNVTASEQSYKLSLVGMTETVSTSDRDYVAEKGQLLKGGIQATVTEGGTLSGDTVTVSANGTAKVKVTYTLTDADKKLIDSLFPYGMYVEGFVKLQATEQGGIDLNIPFLAFYG